MQVYTRDKPKHIYRNFTHNSQSQAATQMPIQSERAWWSAGTLPVRSLPGGRGQAAAPAATGVKTTGLTVSQRGAGKRSYSASLRPHKGKVKANVQETSKGSAPEGKQGGQGRLGPVRL